MTSTASRAHRAIVRFAPIVLAALLFAGCASGPGSRTIFTPAERTPPPEETGAYQVEAGHGPDLVADLRAAAAPASPEVVDGKSAAADEKRLGAQSFLRIGTSHFPPGVADARDRAIKQGQRVGADRVIFYAPPTPDGDLTVAYYVRFKLPFGATFRDLRAAERDQVGAGGVVIGSVINDSPAARANLLAGDIVLKCDGAPVANRAGHPVTLTIVRNGETMDRSVRLGPLTTTSAP